MLRDYNVVTSGDDRDTTNGIRDLTPYESKILAMANDPKTPQTDGRVAALIAVAVSTIALVVAALAPVRPNASGRFTVPVALLIFSFTNYLHRRFKQAALSVIRKLQVGGKVARS